jgi:4-amino-4-deoxy-L-arabinose transferase-like glycosyltransferase
MVALTLLVLLRWYVQERPPVWLAAGAGVLAAMSILVKLTNAAILVPLVAVILLRFWRDRQLLRIVRESWLMLLCAGVPVFLWGLRNRQLFGDWSATAAKVEQLTWTTKPIAEWFNHPIFSLHGPGIFLGKLCASLFNGDLTWNGAHLHSDTVDIFFRVCSALLPVIGLVVAIYRGKNEPKARLAAGISALLVVAFLGVLVMLSIRFDYGECKYPSNDFPYFASGRLIAGGLVPFFALWAYGIQALVGRRPILLTAAVVLIAGVMIRAQLIYLAPMMHSAYNWFHLP